MLDEWAESGAMEGEQTAHPRCRALLASLQGRPDEVERWATEAAAPASGDTWDKLEVLRARGIAALFAHEPERAAGALGEVWEHTLREGVADPGAFPVAGDLVEALVWLGRIAEADAVTAPSARSGGAPGASVGTGHRRSLRGDGPARRRVRRARRRCGWPTRPAATASLACASTGPARCCGSAGRRGGPGSARRHVGRSRRRARSSMRLARLAGPGRHAPSLTCSGPEGRHRQDGLTAAEQRVVDLAASGLSNKQIARRLYRGGAHGGGSPRPRLRQARRPFPGAARQSPRIAGPAARHGLRVSVIEPGARF